MNLIMRYISKYTKAFIFAMVIRLFAVLVELTMPYILEYIIDDVVPLADMSAIIKWSLLMFAAAILCYVLSAWSNYMAVENAHFVSYDVRKDLFEKVINLSGNDFDEFTLPSLISRMTSDSYNVQDAVQRIQTMLVRSPMILIGGLIMTISMSLKLSSILIVMVPLLIVVAVAISSRGIPLFDTVQDKLDTVVRIMRESITGIRVVKALGKEDYQQRKFASANKELKEIDINASTIMAVPGPIMQMCLNIGLVFVVIMGANMVNDGSLQPGVIMAFLTYFNMITNGLMGINRIFVTFSKAAASGKRIDEILQADTSDIPLALQYAYQPKGKEFVRFENVDFYYGSEAINLESREKALDNISFTLEKGESLGIIGPTGCGKTTFIYLLMLFYDATSGAIFVDGRDVRTYKKDELHRKFGVCFQNDMIFQDTIRENIDFGRDVGEDAIFNALEQAMAMEYINSLENGIDYQASIKGANLSGGQKQRVLVARAIAGDPDILVLDDSSSALDYKTDAEMRKAIMENHQDTALILIAQRVSSVMNMDKILVMDEGKCIGYGTHQELLDSCPQYYETYKTQMGAIE